MKKTKYKRVKNTIWAGASSSIVAGMIFMGGSNTALAENFESYAPTHTKNTKTGMHMMHRWNSPTKINSLATHLGLDKNRVREELKSGKALKQILQDNGIVPGQLQKAFNSKKKSRVSR